MHKTTTSFIPPLPKIEGKDKLRRLKYPVFVSIKYDGEYGYYKDAMVFGKDGGMRTAFPVTDKLQELGKVELMGELYYGDGKNGSIDSLNANLKSHDLRLAVFDMPFCDPINLRNAPLEERLGCLNTAWKNTFRTADNHVHLAEGWTAESESEVMSIFHRVTDEGYEGVVIKSMSSPLGMNWIKIKHYLTADLEVALIDPDLERIEVYVPEHNRTCGVKVQQHIKATLSVGDIVEIKFFGRLRHGGLRNPQFKRKREQKRTSIDS